MATRCRSHTPLNLLRIQVRINLTSIARKIRYSPGSLYRHTTVHSLQSHVLSTQSSGSHGHYIVKSNEHRIDKRSRIITTLSPNRLTTRDFLDLSGSKQLFHPEGHVYYQRTEKSRRLPWPLGSRGFLYWHHDQGAPLLSSAVRLRHVPDGQPSSFASGSDLLLPDVPLFHPRLRRQCLGGADRTRRVHTRDIGHDHQVDSGARRQCGL
ncbi:hypothetical protein NEOLEDRAFT_389281 [Neolentinus lepideus HHB14362 ss-1]|uniref:Uncharacterized protein n=1 Tax=Neolentinus lepideus HHB14362 ss-1 TaxID=1314782 RepID=A0A165SFQ2_9AGAM|nr:hypothetical protein NEOLEDRAFT_389281 [Neolentinus lepideus HHB14362 ss-1]